MKKSEYLRILLVIVIVSLQTHAAIADPKASIEFKDSSIDFGEITIDKPVTAEFMFKNPGMVPLIISKVESSCGCTIADYPKQPITSGGEGKIIVTYDSKAEGYFSKTITVYTNTETGLNQLHIEGVVIR